MAKMGCAKCGGTMKKMAKGGQALMTKTMPGYNATTNPMSMKTGGSTSSKVTAVKQGCPPGTQRLANGGCGQRSLYGG